MRKILHQLALSIRQKIRGTPKYQLHKLAFNRDDKKQEVKRILHQLVLRNDVENLEKELKKCTFEDINVENKGLKFTPLFTATIQGKVEPAKLLIKYGANVNALDVYGRPPLYYIGDPSPVPSATAENRLQVAKLLLDKGADVNITDADGAQPLWRIVYSALGQGKEDELPIVKLLLEYGADPDFRTKPGGSPLDFAKKVGYQPIIELLEIHKKI
ncbi:ankyrin repeat domain-containing protein [Snodgrassella sp. B3882]|uniref:ankyrin repeat domain-containing protein n=1 Tax=Snodgrassella sp. B3882 TaxID=2818037 RepID=UPI002269D43A|nr:ankyrin repeat domain-containing protein [Snodgrassella sp. B3882]MCX8744621.1 ankyrin repeat domain-containing protein [Snodgrassella sp. B3882]